MVLRDCSQQSWEAMWGQDQTQSLHSRGKCSSSELHCLPFWAEWREVGNRERDHKQKHQLENAADWQKVCQGSEIINREKSRLPARLQQ